MGERKTVGSCLYGMVGLEECCKLWPVFVWFIRSVHCRFEP